MELLPLPQFFLNVALSLILVYSTVILYRIFLHPLRHIPGPKIAACTGLHEVFCDLLIWPGGQFTAVIRKMHEDYGPIVRISPSEVSINDPDFHEKLYASHPEVRDKIPMVANILGTTAGTFGTIDHHLHRKRRAASSSFFSNQNVSKSHILIRSHVDKLCSMLRESIGTEIQARIRFLALKLDIFFDFAFADNLGLQEKYDEALKWDRTMEAISTCAPYVKLFPWILPLAIKLPVWCVNMVSRPLAQVLRINDRIYRQAHEFSCHTSEKSDAASDRPKGLFETLKQSGLPRNEKSAWRMSQEGSEMFAASGTTARVMTTCIYYLHNRSETLYRLQEELDDAIPDPYRIPELRILESLTYLNAVIRESLRLASPVATRLPLRARQPLSYKDWLIPVNTPISVNGRDLLHNTNIYEDSLSFLPERWLPSDRPEIPERYFVPFNKGSRMCQGRDFAMAELRITIATLIRRFEFELVDTIYSRDVQVVRDCFLTEILPGSRGVKFKVCASRK